MRLRVTRISIKARQRSSSSIRTGWWQRRSVSVRATLLALCTDGARILGSLRGFARRHDNLLALSFLVLEIARLLIQLLRLRKRVRGVAVRARGPGDLDRILRLIESHGCFILGHRHHGTFRLASRPIVGEGFPRQQLILGVYL